MLVGCEECFPSYTHATTCQTGKRSLIFTRDAFVQTYGGGVSLARQSDHSAPSKRPPRPLLATSSVLLHLNEAYLLGCNLCPNGSRTWLLHTLHLDRRRFCRGILGDLRVLHFRISATSTLS